MRNKKSIFTPHNAPATRSRRFPWRWVTALGLAILAVFSLLDMGEPDARGLLHEHLSGTLHASALLTLAAIALALLDFFLARAKRQ